MLVGVGKNREVGETNVRHFDNKLEVANAGLQALGYQAVLRKKEGKNKKHFLSRV